MKGIRKISITALDRKWGKLVRERDNACAFCLDFLHLQAHHVFGRARNGTRFMLENGISLCFNHHVRSDTFSAHKTPEKFKRWMKRLWGVKEFNRLERMSLKVTSRSKAIKEFQQKLSTKNLQDIL